MRYVFHTLLAVILGGLVLAGCQTTPEETAPGAPKVDAPVKQPKRQRTPRRLVQPPRFDSQGNPLYASGQPIARVLYFEFDQARVSEADLRVLSLHAAYLRDFRDRSVSIEGHCDERGTREYNLALGERRAQAVQGFLTTAGVRPSQIEIVSYGEERPVDPGENERAWSKNRRAVMNYR